MKQRGEKQKMQLYILEITAGFQFEVQQMEIIKCKV